jgi:hypothetical protein
MPLESLLIGREREETGPGASKLGFCPVCAHETDRLRYAPSFVPGDQPGQKPYSVGIIRELFLSVEPTL